MNEIRPYGRFDIGRIKARRDFAGLMADGGFHGGEPDRTCTWSLTTPGGWSVKACGGYIRERNGVFALWGYCADDLTRRDWVMIARHTRWLIDDMFRSGAHRVHALALAGHAEAVAFLMHLGLRNDMNRITGMGPNGEDFVLLAALKEFRQ
ncbi:hypothetical protein [Asticcacaulis taihuensis]|uniref:hypothetical protein n=1 Tax=Asticcacaulis taihuensis TaxID=260084 RepID=UPI0026EAC300|nr:hypothetical protein [Asticcacaulis taihuensis]